MHSDNKVSPTIQVTLRMQRHIQYSVRHWNPLPTGHGTFCSIWDLVRELASLHLLLFDTCNSPPGWSYGKPPTNHDPSHLSALRILSNHSWQFGRERSPFLRAVKGSSLPLECFLSLESVWAVVVFVLLFDLGGVKSPCTDILKIWKLRTIQPKFVRTQCRIWGVLTQGPQSRSPD